MEFSRALSAAATKSNYCPTRSPFLFGTCPSPLFNFLPPRCSPARTCPASSTPTSTHILFLIRSPPRPPLLLRLPKAIRRIRLTLPLPTTTPQILPIARRSTPRDTLPDTRPLVHLGFLNPESKFRLSRHCALNLDLPFHILTPAFTPRKTAPNVARFGIMCSKSSCSPPRNCLCHRWPFLFLHETEHISPDRRWGHLTGAPYTSLPSKPTSTVFTIICSVLGSIPSRLVDWSLTAV